MNIKKATIALTLGLITILSSNVTNASTESKSQNSNNSTSSFRPPGKSQPRYTVGGATRGNTCGIDRKNKGEITALVPQKDRSLTQQSHPTFFAYVSPLNEDKAATLIVKDLTEDYYYSQQLIIPASGGIVKMTPAEDAPELEIDKDYTWFLRIQCNANLEPEDPQISASVKRVRGKTSDLSQSDLTLTYNDSQIWYDSLENAYELYQSGDDVYLSELLNNINMNKAIAQQKITKH